MAGCPEWAGKLWDPDRAQRLSVSCKRLGVECSFCRTQALSSTKLRIICLFVCWVMLIRPANKSLKFILDYI